MWTRMAVLLALAAAAAALPTACSIENCEEGAYCPGDGHDSAERECRATCGRLAACGRIDESERWTCTEACLDSLWEDEERTEDYCECVEDSSSCSELTRRCGRPPFDVPPSECADDERVNSRGECVPEPAADAGPAPSEDAGSEPAQDASASVDAAPQPDAGTTPPEPGSDAAPSSDTGAPDAEVDAAPCPCESCTSEGDASDQNTCGAPACDVVL